MPQENIDPSGNFDTSLFKVDVVPIHHTRVGGPLMDTAREQIHMRDEASEAAAKLEADIVYLQELRELPPQRNIFKRRRQRHALISWLGRKGYIDPDEAHNYLSAQHTSMIEDVNNTSTSLERVWLPKVREALGELHEDDKVRADKLFRANDFPGDVLESCEQQAARSGRDSNLVAWLSQTPTAEESYGASNEELESVLLWNAFCTERMASNPKGVEHMVNEYLSKINKKVIESQLDESWAHATPHISRIIVGDIMNARFLSYKDARRGGHYDRDTRTLTIWPYELEDESYISHVWDHECGHALGGFKEKWLDEGFVEAFTRIIDGEDPFGGSTVYNMNRQGVRKLLEGAGTTCKDASAFFIGHNVETNEARLGEFLTQAYDGNDVLAIINKAYRESFEDNDLRLHDPKTKADAFFVATFTATVISDLFKEAQKDAKAVAERTKNLALNTESNLRHIAFKHAYVLFANMANQQA